ncbi:HEAT repeat domain-containing protein [Halorussus halobius]|uniref:HEAT repeat domain-containing protein n=1 Tax=Halorussus halobius TaxID=1710537 RepID=UPI00109220BC|nr:HEAT repeat domain-containing protein [Halorussus halobius]
MPGDERDAGERGVDERDADATSARADRLRERARRIRANARLDSDPDPAHLDQLFARLGDEDPEERAEAAWDIAELATDHPDRSWRLPVESTLAPLLDDDDQWVRRGASWAMATVADGHPERVRPAVSALADSLTDDDPLVRENTVLAVSDVASEFPFAAKPALDRLVAVVRNDDGLARQYAAETLQLLVRQLDENGFPETIAATSEVADLLPDDAEVVVATDDEQSGDSPVRVGGSESDADDEQATTGPSDSVESLGPPDRITEPSPFDAERAELQSLGDLGGDPLTTAVKARAPAGAEDPQGVVTTVRTLRSDADVDPSVVEAAFRAWAGVDDHDHVLPVLDRGRTPRPWLATEFADAGTLRDHVGRVGFDRALWYAHRVTTAVCHAHARGVVHGALRPGAVGLSRALGAWPVPKVGDWGFGEALAAVRTPPVPPAFAAPEHLAPDEFGRPDPATDVYQLGALCYVLFAGRPPFAGDPATVARRVRSEPPPTPSEFAPDLPGSVDDVVERALTKEKRARFETAEDLRRRLEVVAAEHGPTDWEP